ncbi:A24 family peptidase [Bacillus sp. V2I10]|uniref:prepilin peptidase n=1 Tax=Bacillus sp. V2I10 TaxID=3042276 RepID=UPI002785AEA3|nr:A24 family peptidase [Bacillus sp. V2I10]MDQ0858211.1 leader peptidase (prepilin peptidase)/N-methyltransferase [Bacillus sp. V2I10]
MANIFLFFYGLLLGSFFNVVGLRIPNKESIAAPRSACPGCHHTLTAGELIPVISYLLQGGKCRKCRMRISPLYPFVELKTAILFAISPLLAGWSKDLVIALTLISLFMIIFVSDMKYMIIPDKVLLFFAGLFVIERIFIPLTPWWNPLIGAAAGFILLYGIAILSKGKGMGGGDIKLFAVLGLAIGWKLVLLSFFLSCVVGSIIGVLAIMTGKVKRKQPIPFGPSIMVGTIAAYFYGQELLQWYFKIIGY